MLSGASSQLCSAVGASQLEARGAGEATVALSWMQERVQQSPLASVGRRNSHRRNYLTLTAVVKCAKAGEDVLTAVTSSAMLVCLLYHLCLSLSSLSLPYSPLNFGLLFLLSPLFSHLVLHLQALILSVLKPSRRSVSAAVPPNACAAPRPKMPA